MPTEKLSIPRYLTHETGRASSLLEIAAPPALCYAQGGDAKRRPQAVGDSELRLSKSECSHFSLSIQTVLGDHFHWAQL
jgi:hypothetical protein